MVTFVLAVILIILATLALLVWPLLFTRNTFSYARHAQNIHYAKERLAELEEQLKNATISATDYEALKLEIETTLADDSDLANNIDSESSTLPRRPNKAAISALCIFVPLGAAAFYTYVGTPEALNSQAAVVNNQQHGHQTPDAQQIYQMVANLEQRLLDNPSDMQGWALLSRTYIALGQYSKAVIGLKRVIELGGENAEIYASLADASALSADGNMIGDPILYADKALSLNPDNRQALWLRGLAAVQLGDKDQAQRHWGRLLGILDEQPEQQNELRKIMVDALGADSLAGPGAAESSENSMPSAASEPQTTNNAIAAVEGGLNVVIELDDSLLSQANPQDLVFVFARAKNGPPPPVAVKRLRVSDLPTSITLSDKDAMVPQFKMSLFPDLTVSARLSKSGPPVAQSGDFESQTISAQPGQQDTVRLRINKVVK